MADSQAETQQAIHALFATGQAITWEAGILTRDQERIFAKLVAQPLCQEGAVVAAQISCLDISAYHQALTETEQIRQSLERQRQEAAALYSIGVSCTLALDLDEVFHLIYAQVDRLFTFSTFGIILYDETSDEISAELVIHKGRPVPKQSWSLSDDRGLIGYVIRNARPLLIRSWPRERLNLPVGQDRFIDPQTYSWLSVPLVGKDQVLGVMCLQSTEANAYSEVDRRSLWSIADQATMVIENARLHQQTEQQLADLQKANREMQALQDMSSVLQSSLDSRNVFSLIVHGVVTWLDYHYVALVVADEENSTLVVRATATGPNLGASVEPAIRMRWQDIVIPQNQEENLIVRAAQEGKIDTTRSLYDLFRPEIDPATAHQLQHALQIRNMVTVPLLTRGRLVGSLVAGTGRQEISGREIALLSAFANQSAIAIENAQLYEAQRKIAVENAQLYETVNQQLDEVSTLYMLANQVSSSLDPQVVLNSITDILKKVLDCRGCCIFLLNDSKEWLEIRAASGISPHWQREARLRMGEGTSGKAAEEAQAIYIADTHQEPDFIIFDPAVRSLLVVPLVYQGEVIGTLNVDDDQPNAFTNDMARLLTIAGSQAAAAIQNAKLYADLKERAGKLAQAHSELQESDRIKSEFVQNVSHELRTPLTFVKAYAELLLDGSLGPLPDNQRESLQIVSDRTNRIIELVSDILSLQQIERGELQFSSLSLAEAARASLQGAQATARQEGISLVEDFAPDLRHVWGDRTRLEQVFDNLIGNAVKFSPDGGTITVRLSNDGDLVRAAVVDEGIGIRQDQLTKIFDRFYQVDGSSKRRFGGTGLGLAIVKEIVEAHQGTIGVESQLGVGSTFSFTIPVAPQGQEKTLNQPAHERRSYADQKP
jgi:signal transduction histidine kinase